MYVQYSTEYNIFYNSNYFLSSSMDLISRFPFQENINNFTSKIKNKILLVEDEIAFQCLHKTALRKMGYILDLAENGQQAISLFDLNRYDLILLDIGLPDISGIEVGKYIRTHTRGRSIPILALTGYGKLIESECLAAGFNEVLSKPIQLNQLESILKENLKKSH